ncbi:nedd8 activating enzyme [Moniliophthora roreri]|nr:nedd8 activating enzyme [Moniliophthora roreri]
MVWLAREWVTRRAMIHGHMMKRRHRLNLDHPLLLMATTRRFKIKGALLFGGSARSHREDIMSYKRRT